MYVSSSLIEFCVIVGQYYDGGMKCDEVRIIEFRFFDQTWWSRVMEHLLRG